MSKDQVRVALRYVNAFLDQAEESKALDAVAADIHGLKGLLNVSEDFARFVKSPLLSRDTKVKAIIAISVKAKFHQLTQNFLALLASNRRLMALWSIIRVAEEEIANRKGLVKAEVKTAHVLTKAQTKALQDSLKKAIGKETTLEIEEDESIIGGLIVKVGSRMIDDSVKTKLERLTRRLKSGKSNLQQTEEEVA